MNKARKNGIRNVTFNLNDFEDSTSLEVSKFWLHIIRAPHLLAACMAFDAEGLLIAYLT